jgi:hypothetical protein
LSLTNPISGVIFVPVHFHNLRIIQWCNASYYE